MTTEQRIGRQDIAPHDLQHTAASMAIRAGANVKAVEHMLGHASAAMTLDVYAGLFRDDLDGVASALDVMLRDAQRRERLPDENGAAAVLPLRPRESPSAM